MAKQHAILVGLKEVNPDAYSGWDGKSGCQGCELDVDTIERILTPLGYSSDILKTVQATKEQVLKSLKAAANLLESGDTLVFYYSGHGGQKLDQNDDELDEHDETLMAYDGEILDDDLNEIWLRFQSDVRIVMISDSCNSGSNFKPGDVPVTVTPIKPIDASISQTMQAQLIHLGGCRDSAVSIGYPTGGAFTTVLSKIWREGKFCGNYKDFYEKIKQGIDSGQEPQYNEYGAVTDSFRNAQPFSSNVLK